MLYYLFCSVLAQTLRVDRETETEVMATIHCFLRERNCDLDNPLDAILYGPSTQNKIERWWRELHERMERFFKEQLKQWRSAHWLGLVKKLRAPTVRGPHQPQPIVKKIRTCKKVQVKNQLENEKLTMLNNKASINNGS